MGSLGQYKMSIKEEEEDILIMSAYCSLSGNGGCDYGRIKTRTKSMVGGLFLVDFYCDHFRGPLQDKHITRVLFARIQKSEMAIAVSQGLLITRTFQTNPSPKSQTLAINHNCSARLQADSKSSGRKNIATSLQSLPTKPKPSVSSKRVNSSQETPPSSSSLSNSLSTLILHLRCK